MYEVSNITLLSFAIPEIASINWPGGWTPPSIVFDLFNSSNIASPIPLDPGGTSTHL